MTPAPLVLFAEYTDLDPEPARRLLNKHGIRTELLVQNEDGNVDREQTGAIGLIAGYSEIGRGLIDQFPALGIIATSSNGVDMIDVAYAVGRGIWVTNVGHAATEEVATHTLALALSTLRELPAMRSTVESGGWTDDLTVVPRRISELTLGLVGYGKIGAMMARISVPLFGDIIAYDPFRPADDGAARPVSLAEVFEWADVLSLHLPLTEATQSLVNADVLRTVKDGAVLVNPSRGELIDEQAVIAALDGGKLSAYAADVLTGEPPAKTHPFRHHSRTLVTPHAAFLSHTALRRYEEDPARYIVEWHRDGAPSECVVGTPRQ